MRPIFLGASLGAAAAAMALAGC
ncbi:MAG: hypothetical protein JWO81_344, partial [Alphaproteobacteria bacterium]|nr:hypothetical protein [Alphaproteobacteria bacterium]